MDHSNLFHAALIKIQDIAKNGTNNIADWHAVLTTVNAALAEARRLEAIARERAADKFVYDHT